MRIHFDITRSLDQVLLRIPSKTVM